LARLLHNNKSTKVINGYQKTTMSVKHLQLNTIVYLLLALSTGLCIGLSLGLFGGLGIGKITTGQKPVITSGPIYPVRIVKITIDPNQQDKLFEQLRKFTDKWKYAILIDPEYLHPEKFEIYLWRSDMRAAGDYPRDPGMLQIDFYNTDLAAPVPERFFDEEIADFKIFINEIPNATFIVEKP